MYLYVNDYLSMTFPKKVKKLFPNKFSDFESPEEPKKDEFVGNVYLYAEQ